MTQKHSLRASVLRWSSFTFAIGAGLGAQTNWYERTPLSAPSARSAPAMVYDAARDRSVLFGGISGSPLGDTWQWNGSEWSAANPATSPPPRYHHAMVWDSLRQQVVLFGGDGAALLDDTWIWDGATWAPAQVWNRPPARMVHAMAYDSRRAATVLFGGIDAGFAPMGDTWEWDGQQWWPAANSGPTARAGTAMAFDPQRRETVLFGGVDAAWSYLDDTWIWDGSTWTQRSPAVRPTGRQVHRMVWDGDRGRVVMFGGEIGFLAPVDETWEWNGTAWTRQTFGWHWGLFRRGPGMAFDSVRRRAVVFGGDDGFSDRGDTWEYLADTTANYETYGQGCASPAGVPWLSSHQGSLPWRGAVFSASLVHVSQNPAHALIGILGDSDVAWGGIWLPFDLGAFGMPGCALRTNPYATVVLGNLGGRAIWSIPIPSTPVLTGLSFFLQGAAPSLGANAGGLVLSNGCRIRVG